MMLLRRPGLLPLTTLYASFVPSGSTPAVNMVLATPLPSSLLRKATIPSRGTQRSAAPVMYIVTS